MSSCSALLPPSSQLLVGIVPCSKRQRVTKATDMDLSFVITLKPGPQLPALVHAVSRHRCRRAAQHGTCARHAGAGASNYKVLHCNPGTKPETRSLMQALEQLFHARRILGYSYVFAFYMFGNDMFRDEVSPAQNAVNQNLFEDQQQQLEGEVRPYLCPVNCRSQVTN